MDELSHMEARVHALEQAIRRLLEASPPPTCPDTSAAPVTGAGPVSGVGGVVSLAPSEVLKAGTLMKRGRNVRLWKLRWMVLEPEYLCAARASNTCHARARGRCRSRWHAGWMIPPLAPRHGAIRRKESLTGVSPHIYI